MNTVVETLTGMNTMTDQVIATDFLIGTKTAVKDLALAFTESSSTEVRELLRRHLDEALNMHHKASEFMASKGWYDAYNISHQIQMDLKTTETVLNL